MVLTLKVISCAINYNDGLLKEEEGLSEAQKKNRLIKLPSLIEYIGYCLCCGSHFAGPVYEMKDYLEWTDGKGVCPFFCFDFFLPQILDRCSYIEFRILFFFRFGSMMNKTHLHHHIGQPLELFSKLVFAWACICTWYRSFHCPASLIRSTMIGHSGSVLGTNIWQASPHAGNITSSGQFPRPPSLFLAWVSVVGRNLPHLNHAGTVQRMSTFLHLSS